MDFDLTDEQRAFRETARAFAREEWLTQAPGWDERQEFPVEALRRAAALGFAGIYVGEEFGGSGLGRVDAAIIFEELAAACASTAAYLSIHNMASWMIDRFGSAEQRARFLPDLTSMAHLSSYCLTEPGSGSDAAALATRAVRDGDDYVLNGDQGVHLGRRRQRHLCRDGADRRPGAKGHLVSRRRKGDARPLVRQEGKKTRLELAADGDGDLRGLPGAGGQSDRRRRATGSRSR